MPLEEAYLDEVRAWVDLNEDEVRPLQSTGGRASMFDTFGSWHCKLEYAELFTE